MSNDIIAMAREAGAIILDGSDTSVIQRLVQLAQAAERNKLAAWMQAQGYATGHGDTTEDLLKELEWQVRESEREACAKVCEDEAWRLKKIAVDMHSGSTNMKAIQASIDAAAIRARGQAS